MRAKRGHEPSPRLHLVLLFALTLISSPAWSQLQAGSPWPKYRQNIGNTGLGIGSATSNGTFLWSQVNGYFKVCISAIAADGTLYETARGGILNALTPAGVPLWGYVGTAGSYEFSPTIGSDGTIYLVEGDSDSTQTLIALTPKGATKWTLALGENTANSPTIDSNGTIYIGFTTSSGGGQFEAINPDGTVQWTVATNYGAAGSAAIGPDGTIYVSDYGDLYAYNFDGTLKWSYPLGGLSPTVGSDGTIYLANGGNLTAFNSDGTIKWTFTPTASYEAGPLSTPAIGPDGTIYTLASGSQVMAFGINSDGSVKFTTYLFQYTGEATYLSDIAVASDGSFYVSEWSTDGGSQYGGGVYSVSSTGTVEWTAPGGVSNVIGADGTLYVGGFVETGMAPDGVIYAYNYTGSTIPVSSLTLSPSTVVGGESSTCTVTLASAAPTGGDRVNLKGSGPATLSLTYVVIPAGQTTATFKVSTVPTITTQSETVTATSGGGSVNSVLTITPPTITSIVLNPTAVTAGQASTATITLSSAAPDPVVNLKSSNPAVASVPATVTVYSTGTTATFAVTTYGDVNQTTVSITATLASSSQSANITVNPATLYGVSVSPSTVLGGSSTAVTGTATLYGLAPSAGDVVTLTSSNPSAASVPASVTVPSGTDSTTFAVTTKAVNANTQVTISASFGGVTKTTVLTVATNNPIAGLTLSPSTIGGLGTSTGTVTLYSAAPAGGFPVTLVAGAAGYVSMPTSVIVSAGATSATFTITGTGQRGSTVNLGIVAENGGYSVQSILTIQGDLINSLAFKPASISGTSSTTGTVTLTSAAPTGGWIVYLKAGAPGFVSMPSSVTVPAGATSVSFTVTGTGTRTTTINLGIIASDGNSSKEAILTIAPTTIVGISLNPSTIGGLGSSTATVSLSAAAPTGGWTVNLLAGASGYVSMPSSITIPAGATSGTFTVTGTGQRGSTINLGIIAGDPNSSAEAILTIQGDLINSFTLKPASISGTSSTTGTVTLNSAAPNGGWVISLTAGAPGYVSMPAKVTVPAGATSVSFTITGTSPRSTTTTLGIIASDGNSSKEAILTIAPTTIAGISLKPSTIGGLGTSVATVTLTAAAPTGGWQVNLLSGASGYVTMPSSITVPAGATSGTFTITGTAQRSATINLGIIAGDPNSSAEAILTIQGDLVTSLSLSPSSVAPGAGSTGTVTISTAAPPGGWIINLTVGAPAYVGVPATVTVPAGATSATFSIATKTTDPSTQVLVIGSDGNSQASAKLTIT